ncbi:membrane protein of ER body-like protein isoform X2 [Lolium rigidum]|uniref:membrane protein of ER body-like protein isoform X2 n=1 Tax=Lolium rigidum TaxID=89674 RepID=UPI001F5CF601|nr:membrane protein of ER body-like protein isoform X2 [Lolium rigidum]
MMEVVAEPAWDQFKEEVEIMEEEGGSDAAAGELLTREIKKRLLEHAAHDNGNGNNGHINGEEAEAAEEEEQHKSISFDPAKVPHIITEVSARYLVTEAARSGPEEEETNETPSPKGKEIETHENGSAQEANGSHTNGSHQVSNSNEPEIADMMLRIDKTEIFPDEVKKEEHVTKAQLEEKGSQSNGSHQLSTGAEPEIPYMFRIDKTEIFPDEVDKVEHKTEAQPEENGSHSSSSHQVPNGAEPEITHMFQINKTENFPTEVAKNEHVTEVQPEIEEYDLEKILDQQETHDLYCPNCKSCITRRVILRKRKRRARPTTPTEQPKRLHTQEAPLAPTPESGGQEAPDVFRCLSCFSYFIPTGCSFNIFRIFGRRDQQVDVLPPPESEDMHPSQNCTSWLLSCFQPGDSPNQAVAHSLQTPQLHDAATSGEHRADSLQTPLLQGAANSGDTATTTTATSTSYVHTHDKVVKPEQSTDELSSSTHQTTTTIITTTTTLETATMSSTTTSAAASTSSHMSSAVGIIHTDEMEVLTGKMPPLKPAGDAILGGNYLLGQEDVQGAATEAFWNGSFSTPAIDTPGVKVDSPNVTNIAPGIIPRGDILTSPNPRAADPPHVAVPVLEDVNPAAPRPQQRDDWDILKAIVYGGLVESITSLSVVSAAASSGAKTLDIFILGIANLIGGLPLIFHNIADLRDIQDVDGNDERIGHYWVNLGRRSKAQLHMVMALLSYIVFGLLPPVLYGLSFRESNDRENKMMVVAAASLACIALLALGKAHVKSRPSTYFKTLMYYLTIAVSCSGLSYVAGVLITRILVSYGVIDEGASGAPPAPPGLSLFPHAVGAKTSSWASF